MQPQRDLYRRWFNVDTNQRHRIFAAYKLGIDRELGWFRRRLHRRGDTYLVVQLDLIGDWCRLRYRWYGQCREVDAQHCAHTQKYSGLHGNQRQPFWSIQPRKIVGIPAGKPKAPPL